MSQFFIVGRTRQKSRGAGGNRFGGGQIKTAPPRERNHILK
jgi:hypothetical protein